MKKPDRYLYFERTADKYLGSILTWLLSWFRPRHSPDQIRTASNQERILLIKLHGIGNIIMMLPAIRFLKRAYPGARIDLLTFESNREIAEEIDELSEIITLSRKNFRHVVLSVMRVIPKVRSSSYHFVIDFEQFAYISALLAFCSAAPRRVGFLNPTHIRHLLFTDPVTYRETEHMSGIFQRLAEALTGSPESMPDRMLRINEANKREADRYLTNSGIQSSTQFVLMHPGSSPNFISRQWPLERFADLADRITAELGCRVLVTGNRSESILADGMLKLMKEKGINAAGELTIMGLAALCRGAAFVVSNDTLLVHLASAVATPVVGLFGPNTPFLYGPGPEKHHTTIYKKLPCSPCLVNVNRKVSDCQNPKCMEAITVDQVFCAIKKNYFPSSVQVKTALCNRQPANLPSPVLSIVK